MITIHNTYTSALFTIPNFTYFTFWNCVYYSISTVTYVSYSFQNLTDELNQCYCCLYGFPLKTNRGKVLTQRYNTHTYTHTHTHTHIHTHTYIHTHAHTYTHMQGTHTHTTHMHVLWVHAAIPVVSTSTYILVQYESCHRYNLIHFVEAVATYVRTSMLW